MCRFTISFSLVFFLSLYTNNCLACDGYKVNLISVENCGTDNVVKIDSNFSADLSADCIVTSKGCLYSKGFKEAKVKYSIVKNGHEMLNGHPDICNVLDSHTAEQKAKLELFGFPTECPVPEGRKCLDGTNKVDISPFKGLLPMAAGQITANYDVTHDTGKSCAVVKFEITK